jgi:ribose 5-phosphate isomerase A
LKIQAFPTSVASEIQARSLGIPLLEPADAAEGLDIAIDGADQFAPGSLDLIKGFGRCALREMVVARLAKRFVIVVGSGKCVSKLGETNAAGRPGRIPVEVVPFAEIFVSRGLARLGLTPEPWNIDGIRGLTDNGNHILDCLTGPIDNPSDLDRAIRALPGVVGTGFFLGMAERVLEGDDSFRLVAEYVRGSA